jgi:ethanolamine permease
VTLYILSLLSLFALRQRQPELQRPFQVPFYPLLPLLALFLSAISLIAMIFTHTQLFLVYVGFIALSLVGYLRRNPIREQNPAH